MLSVHRLSASVRTEFRVSAILGLVAFAAEHAASDLAVVHCATFRRVSPTSVTRVERIRKEFVTQVRRPEKLDGFGRAPGGDASPSLTLSQRAELRDSEQIDLTDLPQVKFDRHAA